MIKPTVMTDSLANAILGNLGCAVHVLQQGEDGGHMDDWGEHVFPAFKIYKAVSVGGDRRTVIADLQAQMQADKGDAVSVWYRHESGSEAAIESATTGPEVFMELAVAFSREANDVAASKTSIKPGDYDQNFGQVLEALHSGYRAAREGWNGKGMFIFLVPGSDFEANRAPLRGIFEKGTPMHYRPHLDMFTADGQVVTWTISQSDALAKDWIILPREHSVADPLEKTIELDIPERPEMEPIISQVLGMKAKVFTELHEVIIGVSKWDTVTINPASIGIIRGELLQEIGTRQPGDVVLWVAGKSVAAELDEVWRESRGVWTHPVKDFYDNSTNKALRDTGYLGMLCGASVIADDTGIIFHDMLMCVLIRNETLIAATGRFITPYVDDHNDVVIDPTPIIKGKATLTELMDLPDPMIEDNFDICSISAEDSVARSIGTVTAKHPQLMVLIEFQIVLDFGKRAMYEQAGLNLPAYKLETVFHDLDFDQDQLDAREALMSNKLSQLVIRQFKMDGSVARYLVLSDLSPETVNIQHDATSCKVARRKATWSFMTLKESKEFPGAL